MARKRKAAASGRRRGGGDPAERWQAAVAAYQRGDAPAARRALAPLLDHPAADANTFLLAGVVAAQLGDPARAEKHLRQAVSEAPRNTDAWLALGNVLSSAGRHDEAAVAYLEVTERSPKNPEVWNNLGVVREDSGRLLDALDCYERTLSLAPDFPSALHGRARVLAQLRRFDAASGAFRRLLERFPGNVAITLDYAEFLEQANRPGEAGQVLETADPGGDKALQARADNLRGQLLIRRGELDPALALLAEARQRTGEGFLGYREGQALDRLGRYAKAFDAFQAGNRARAAQRDFQRVLQQPLEQYLDEKLEAGVKPADEAVEADAIRPVFITGLPRSGTTLLDRMLGAHPAIQVLEELEGLHIADDALADGATPAEARRAYREFNERHVALSPDAVIVDKNPLHLMHLDVLPRLFPDAPVILVLRHPFDAALSCFMQDFNPGPVTARFLELDTTAAVCRRLLLLMRMFERARPGQATRLHYEKLVADFQGEVARVLSVMGLTWHEDIRDYAGKAADGAPIMTASYEQVTRGLYRSSLDRWKSYEPWIDSIKRALGELLPELGYEA